MIQEDRFGKLISKSVFRIIKDIAEHLERIGYIETKNKPNLFCYKSGKVTFYADFRGTNEIPIWMDPKPLIYWFPKRVDENLWLSVLSHFELLGEKGIAKRISFYEESEPGGLTFDMRGFTDDYLSKRFKIPVFIFRNGLLSFVDQDGKCHNHQCGNKFNAPGFFCSDECKKRYIRKFLAGEVNASRKFCAVCGTIILDKTLLEQCKGFLDISGKEKAQIHHTSYFPEKTILVCNKCHQRIHRTEELRELKPPSGDSRKFYNGKKNEFSARMVCTWCEHEWETRTDHPIKCPKCHSEFIVRRFSDSYSCPHCTQRFSSFDGFMEHAYREKSVILRRREKEREGWERKMRSRKVENKWAYARKMGLR
jgi:predicted RNA-binding Zn-ribbon protein involved in translation (DUF1610 family)